MWYARAQRVWSQLTLMLARSLQGLVHRADGAPQGFNLFKELFYEETYQVRPCSWHALPASPVNRVCWSILLGVGMAQGVGVWVPQGLRLPGAATGEKEKAD